jgi:hypothetical protein
MMLGFSRQRSARPVRASDFWRHELSRRVTSLERGVVRVARSTATRPVGLGDRPWQRDEHADRDERREDNKCTASHAEQRTRTETSSCAPFAIRCRRGVSTADETLGTSSSANEIGIEPDMVADRVGPVNAAGCCAKGRRP